MSAYIFQIQSILIILLMIYGISQHKERKKHAKIMGAAILWDILLILQIELNRGAVLKAVDSMTTQLVNKVMLNIHVSLAVTTVILYSFMIYTGLKMIKERLPLHERHRIVGYSVLVLRILTFITSFYTVSK